MKNIKIHALLLLVVSFLLASCEDDGTIPIKDITVWSGSTITFEKASGADPTLEANQDRLTDNVWITRGNEGGQIYNAVTESNSDKVNSPDGTLWALGTTDDLENLVFDTFRTTVTKPQSAVGQDLVLLLSEDEIAIDIKFTEWKGNREGGFTYERSSR